jgi:hypothetical protein
MARDIRGGPFQGAFENCSKPTLQNARRITIYRQLIGRKKERETGTEPSQCVCASHISNI